jgi:glyoxylate utilization-related uncharacterized protein
MVEVLSGGSVESAAEVEVVSGMVGVVSGMVEVDVEGVCSLEPSAEVPPQAAVKVTSTAKTRVVFMKEML